MGGFGGSIFISEEFCCRSFRVDIAEVPSMARKWPVLGLLYNQMLHPIAMVSVVSEPKLVVPSHA